MRSDRGQMDIFQDDPRREADANRAAAEEARKAYQFPPITREERAALLGRGCPTGRPGRPMQRARTQPMTTTTVFLLLAEFGTGHIPLEKCCQHFGMKPEEANKRAARQSLPVPVFRLGSQKSPWLVAADTLASYIDGQRTEAAKQWQKIQNAL